MEEKKEVRFKISLSLFEKLKKEAEELDVPLASYLKTKLGEKNGTRRKKDF